MKNKKQTRLRNVFAMIVIVVFSIVAAYGTIYLEKTNVALEYNQSIAFNSVEYAKFLKQKKDEILSQVKALNDDSELEDTTVFDTYVYVGRFYYDDLYTHDYMLSIKQADDFLNPYAYDGDVDIIGNPFGFLNIRQSTKDINPYLDESVVYFSEKTSETYAYVVFMKASEFFKDCQDFGFEECFVYQSNALKLGSSAADGYVKSGNALSNNLLKANDDGSFLYSTAIDFDYNDSIYLVTKVAKQSYADFVSKLKLNTIIIIALYFIVVVVTALLILLSYSKENKFLKNYKLSQQSIFVVYTDEFGNIKKSNMAFLKLFSVSNVFEQENIDDNFVRLDPCDSLYLKIPDKTGKDRFVNFMCSKTNDTYKLIGLETRNLKRYFMHEFGIEDKAFELESLKVDYENAFENGLEKLFLVNILVSNLEELSKQVGREKFEDAKKKIEKTIKSAFKQFGSVSVTDEPGVVVVLVTNSANINDMQKDANASLIEVLSGLNFDISQYKPKYQIGTYLAEKSIDFEDALDKTRSGVKDVDLTIKDKEKTKDDLEQKSEEKSKEETAGESQEKPDEKPDDSTDETDKK